jgi:hypothetical protein
MSVPDESGPGNDRQLSRYLLGLLPHEETEWLDEASIVDDEVASRLRVLEHELVDAYATGTLPKELLAPFESHYLTTLRRQRHVEFARRFLSAIDQAAHAKIANGRGQKASRLRLPARWIAAAAILLVASGVLLFQTVQLRSGLNLAQTERIELDSRARALERQLIEEREAHATATRELERARASAPATPSRLAQETQTIALVLQPQTRAAGPVPTLAIPPGATSLSFALQFESNDIPRYRVVLKDPGSDQAVWTSGPLGATTIGDMPAVAVAIPSHVLRAQHYSLVLTDGSAGTGDVIGSYTFRIVRP